MRRIVPMLVGLVLVAAAGFAAASIAMGGGFASMLTGSTATATGTTGTTASGRRVTVCHRTGSKKHPFRTITVSHAALAAHLRHGDRLGACSSEQSTKGKGASKAKKQEKEAATSAKEKAKVAKEKSSGGGGHEKKEKGNGGGQEHGSSGGGNGSESPGGNAGNGGGKGKHGK